MYKKVIYSLSATAALLLVGCADAGADKTVKSGSIVELKGDASTASVGGEVKKYKWRQIRGKKVDIDNNKHKNITFPAPNVTTATTLEFKLKTVEKGGSPKRFVSFDFVKVTVQPSNGEDVTPPVITIKGDKAVSINKDETYVDAGATANDDVDGNVDVNMTGEVDTSTPGAYTITYTATDSAGNSATDQRAVTVNESNETNETTDTTAPVITLLGESNTSLNVGDTYVDPGATALDDVDGNVDLNATGEVDTNTPGAYTITYTATDNAGNSATAERNVTVINDDTNSTADTTAPVITLRGESNTSVNLGDTYVDAGATALDNIDGDVDVNITGEADVDTNSVGTYIITYTATDSTGNSAMAERDVHVVEVNETREVNVTVEGNETAEVNVTVEGNETAEVNVTVEGNETAEVNITVEGNETAEVNVTVEGNETNVIADIQSVNVSGEESNYNFSVTLKSSDINCTQYADWWEVLSEDGELLYRRVLGHSHANEQPFTRSGGAVNIQKDQTVYIRAHMNTTGYAGNVFVGTVESQFTLADNPPNFSDAIEQQSPLPRGCAF